MPLSEIKRIMVAPGADLDVMLAVCSLGQLAYMHDTLQRRLQTASSPQVIAKFGSAGLATVAAELNQVNDELTRRGVVIDT